MIVVPVSGGKDSQACLKMAVEKHGAAAVLGVFCDTQWEHPITYAHIDRLRSLYGVKVETISAGSVPDEVRKRGQFPGGTTRFCTDNLKIKPTKKFLRDLAKKRRFWETIDVWYGMRSDESRDRANRYAAIDPDRVYNPHQVMASKYPRYFGTKLGIRFRLPIINWTSAQVFEYLGGDENPLYAQGHDRVGCFPCLVSGDKAKEKAFFHDDFGTEQFRTVSQLGKEIGKSVWTSKGCNRKYEGELSPCTICTI